jgi:ribosomal protein S14
MASTIRRNCKTCGGPRPFTKRGINHILHLLLSIVTLSLWIPIWILLGVLSLLRPHRCEHCGKSAFV